MWMSLDTMPRRSQVALLLLSVFLFAQRGNAQAETGPWPLDRGTYWVYEGRVKWTEPGTNRVHEKSVRWKMTALESAQGSRIRMNLVEGIPAELAWYTPGMRPHRSVLIEKDSTFYLRRFDERPDEAAGLLSNEDKALSELQEEDAILRFPLQVGDFFGQDSGRRHDGLYCWNVEERLVRSLGDIRGVRSRAKREVFLLTYRSMPDHQFVEFAPGIGIIRYQYGHHGTVSEADVRLVEYHRGR